MVRRVRKPTEVDTISDCDACRALWEDTMPRDLSDAEMVSRLVSAGWTPQAARREVQRMMDEAAIEDGM